jgi:hypothetical protein
MKDTLNTSNGPYKAFLREAWYPSPAEHYIQYVVPSNLAFGAVTASSLYKTVSRRFKFTPARTVC